MYSFFFELLIGCIYLWINVVSGSNTTTEPTSFGASNSSTENSVSSGISSIQSTTEYVINQTSVDTATETVTNGTNTNDTHIDNSNGGQLTTTNMEPDVTTTRTVTRETDTIETVNTDTVKTVNTDTVKTVNTDTGKTVNTDTGKTMTTDTGKTVNTDTGKTVNTDTGKTVTTDTVKTMTTDKDMDKERPFPFPDDMCYIDDVAGQPQPVSCDSSHYCCGEVHRRRCCPNLPSGAVFGVVSSVLVISIFIVCCVVGSCLWCDVCPYRKRRLAKKLHVNSNIYNPRGNQNTDFTVKDETTACLPENPISYTDTTTPTESLQVAQEVNRDSTVDEEGTRDGEGTLELMTEVNLAGDTQL